MELADDFSMCFMCGRNPAPPGMICESCEAVIEQMNPALNDNGAWDNKDADEDDDEWDALGGWAA